MRSGAGIWALAPAGARQRKATICKRGFINTLSRAR